MVGVFLKIKIYGPLGLFSFFALLTLPNLFVSYLLFINSFKKSSQFFKTKKVVFKNLFKQKLYIYSF